MNPSKSRPRARYRIHVVGSSPRSGTTLLHALVGSGFQVDGARDHEKSIFEAPSEPCSAYVSKRPRDALVARRILEIDPSVFLLHVARDPRDVVVSRHPARPDDYWTNLRIWKTYHAAARLAAPSSRYRMIRYEDLVSDPDGIQDEIARFLPFLERTNPFSRFHQNARTSAAANEALGGLRAIDRRSVGSWQADPPRLAAQLSLHGSIQSALEALGLERDTRWQARLADVEPCNGTSRMSEFLPIRERLSQWRRRHKQLRRHARLLRVEASRGEDPRRYRPSGRQEDR